MELKMNANLLIATNGFKGTWPSIEYGAWLATALETTITLLGINEKSNPAAIDDHHPLEDLFARAVGLFQEQGAKYSLEIQNGDAEHVIPARVRRGNYITVIGPLGRSQLKRLIVRRSILHLLEQIETPILYVPAPRLPLQKALICVGGLGYEITAEHLAMRMAMKSRAEITLLHIIPPVDLEYPTARAVRDHWQSLPETDTPIGRSLRQALELARADGLIAQTKARKGNVVEEILTEVKEGDYDLLCMGSPYSARALRQLASPNVTAEVMETVSCPVLTARYQRES
jgi:nucleotide-binding universal stress UspA family protein